MTRIDFYTLEKNSGGDRFLLACRLVERIYPKGLRIYVQVSDAAQARHLDRLLWVFKEQSFIPHGLAAGADPTLTPVLIGEQEPPDGENQVLINLSPRVPAALDRFQRLCELVDQDPEIRSAARARYRQYLDRGLELHHHEIRL